MSDIFQGIGGLLVDLDGTVYVGDEPIEGAVEAIKYVKEEKGLPIRFTTNTTTKSNATMYEKLRGMGLPIREEEFFGAIKATVAYLRERGSPSCYLVISDDPREDFEEFEEDESSPDVVVIGDVGKHWDYQLMQKLFEMVMDGADIVALQKGRYWQMPDGLKVDIGALVAGLEYVTEKQATVIGKPSEFFFKGAIDDMGQPAEKVVMIGDDINNDVGGAQQAGMKGVLVKTGKYRDHLVEKSEVKPDLIIDSLAKLTELL